MLQFDIKLICAKLVEAERFISVGVLRNIIEHYRVSAKLQNMLTYWRIFQTSRQYFKIFQNISKYFKIFSANREI